MKENILGTIMAVSTLGSYGALLLDGHYILSTGLIITIFHLNEHYRQ